MTIETLKILLRFILLMLIQVLLLNHINFSGFINPMLYTLALLMVPFEVSIVSGMIIGFITGISLDYFMNSAGMHASACVLMMYVRPRLLKAFGPRDGYEPEAQPSIKTMGNMEFLYFSFFMVIIHHSALFFIEAFSMQHFFFTVGRIILSTIFTVLLVNITQYIMYQTKTR
ncbi:MAG: rod shape-determining protein MreD [Bacteroidia bacterium]|jgi:rod shape-determining protein MreD